MWRAVLETRSLTEVQRWDLEDLDAFLAILEMKQSIQNAAEEAANKK